MDFAFDLFLTYPIAGRLQPVFILEKAIKDLGEINNDNYEKYRYLQLELIIKQCELLSDIAGYINAIEKFTPNNPGVDFLANFLEVYRSFVSSRGNEVHELFKNIADKSYEFFYNIMGYDLLNLLPPDDRKKISEDKLNNSINTVISFFIEMANFYSEFWKVYNAYKHGYRLFVNKAKCGPIECHGEISGNLDILTLDSIIYVDIDQKTKSDKAIIINFSRCKVVYRYNYFSVFQGIINAFNIRLVTAFGGFLNYDLSSVSRPSIRVFKDNKLYTDIPLSLKFQYDNVSIKW